MTSDYCFLDLETTGFSEKEDSIIEIAFVRVRDGKEIARFDQVIVPEAGKNELSPFVSHLTGITQAELDTEGKPMDTVRDEVRELIGDSVIVGHNIDFDIRFLTENGVNLSQHARVDTHELARILLPRETSYSLEVLTQAHGIGHEDAHRAMSDVLASKELFYFLLEKVEGLPQEFLEQIQPMLEQKTAWWAKKFFLESAGSGAHNPQRQKPATTEAPKSEGVVSQGFWDGWETVTGEHTLFCRMGDTQKSVQHLQAVAEQLVGRGEKVLILSPKLKFFEGVSLFPVPEVLLAPERLQQFADARQTLNDQEITFYLKCVFRHFLGYRGMDHFDLFFMERDLWGEINVQDSHHPVFQQIVEERRNQKIMALSPRAFFRFRELPLLQNRVLLMDEGEVFANDLINSPTQEVYLTPYLNSVDGQVAARATFLVAQVCKEVLEAKLQHGIGNFPARVLLHPGDRFPALVQSLRELDPKNEALQAQAQTLENPQDGQVRWVSYFPETGNLSLSTWQESEWEQLKNDLENWKKVVWYRHQLGANLAFFRVWGGMAKGATLELPELQLNLKLEFPEQVVAATSPDLNQYTADAIIQEAKKLENGESLVANFSSLDSLRKVYTMLNESLKEEDVKILGEKAAGGDSKLLDLLSRAESCVLCTQKLLYPELAQRSWKKILVQKFPFLGSGPLMEHLENKLKQNHENYFGLWVMPQVAANLSRRVSLYPGADTVLFLDARKDSNWGRDILESLFKKS